MVKKVGALALILLLIPSLVAAGTAYYIDCSARTDGNGSYTNPWNNIASVNKHNFSIGDDVYFKVNTTCDPANELDIDWDGTSGDKVIIGAYYGDGLFGLNGNARPIIDGNETVPGTYGGLIDKRSGTGHVTIKDIRTNYSAGYGIQFAGNLTRIVVENCYTYRSYRGGVIFSRITESTIRDNIIEESSYNRSPGGSIIITGSDDVDTTYNITISRNRVFHGYEGINIVKKARNVTVEKNEIYDNRSYHLYADAAKTLIFRYNLLYESAEGRTTWGGPDKLIAIDNETARAYCYTGDTKIYGNLVAAGSKGISVANQYNRDIDPACHTNNVKIFNNTIVDCDYNFQFNNLDLGWSGNEVKNNISLTQTEGTGHASGYSPAGFSWSHNNFDESVSGDTATNAIIGNPQLAKTSGWHSLAAGRVTGREFITGSDGPAKNAGKAINGYNGRISSSDFTANPIMVRVETDSTPDIGAWMVESESGGFGLEAPLNLEIVSR